MTKGTSQKLKRLIKQEVNRQIAASLPTLRKSAELNILNKIKSANPERL